jgi:hypothetical protein
MFYSQWRNYRQTRILDHPRATIGFKGIGQDTKKYQTTKILKIPNLKSSIPLGGSDKRKVEAMRMDKSKDYLDYNRAADPADRSREMSLTTPPEEGSTPGIGLREEDRCI